MAPLLSAFVLLTLSAEPGLISGSALADVIKEDSSLHTHQDRVAARLQKRLEKHMNVSPSITTLKKALEQKKALKQKTIEATFHIEGEAHTSTGTISALRNPGWIVGKFGWNSAEYSFDLESIKQSVAYETLTLYPSPDTVTVSNVAPDKDEIKRAHTDIVGKSGYALDPSAAQDIYDALTQDISHLVLSLSHKGATIVNESSMDLGNMQLLATGKSNYAGSPFNRIHNVRKALHDHVNNTVVAPGETFSFNSTLGGAVSNSNGWAMAKVIFNQTQLQYAPGGGICQASTTVYRAALLAGFPIVKRAPHSLYVTYYEEYGVGIDATIFPGSQDLVFQNNTPGPLLIQAYTTDEHDAVVNIYGTPDGREVELSGPYFTANTPEVLHAKNNRPLRSNEIGWVQKVRMPDGSITENTIVSRYIQMPRSVANKYEPETYHAAAW